MFRTNESTDVTTIATSLQAGLDKVDKMIAWGRRVGYTEAAINLEQWRNAKGDRVMRATSFQGKEFVLQHLRDHHRAKIIAGVKKRLENNSLAAGGSVELDWTDSVYSPPLSDFYFALGGFTVHSRVKATVVENNDGKRVATFPLWLFDIADTYDWDAGKFTYIPGLGKVTDDEMLALEQAGYGKSFKITSERAICIDPRVTRDALL